jgi:hypothetical protein
MAEYSPTEREQILAQLDPRDSRQWRAWALTVLFRYCGPRQNAARHLTLDDIDLEASAIAWRPELDKTGEARVQPMPASVREAFLIALGWAQHDGYTGPWVFYSPTRRIRTDDAAPYTYQAYNQALRTAEDRAGVVHKKYRAAHGYRRGVATDIHAMTGSTRAAADWIGDKSVKIVDKHYVQTRDEEMRKYAQLVEGGMARRRRRSARRRGARYERGRGRTPTAEIMALIDAAGDRAAVTNRPRKSRQRQIRQVRPRNRRAEAEARPQQATA